VTIEALTNELPDCYGRLLDRTFERQKTTRRGS
jgi:hypothetical protein